MFFVARAGQLLARVTRFLAVLRAAPVLTVDSLCAATLFVPAVPTPLWTPAAQWATSALGERAPPA